MSAPSGGVVAEEEEPVASEIETIYRPTYDELGEESLHPLGHQTLKVPLP